MSTAPVQESAPRLGPQPAPAGIAPPVVDPAAYTDDAPEFSEKTRAILATPVDPELVETRATTKDGPEKLLFVPWVHYQSVLLAAFGQGGYRMVPRGPARTEGNTITWTGALFVRAPGATKFQFIKEAKGECGMHGGMTPGNAAEGAQSDCLVKCCKALGIFMELFDPRWRRAWEAKYRPTHQQNKSRAQWPAARAGVDPVPPAAATSTGSASNASASAASSAPATSAAAAGSTSSAASESGTVSPIDPDTGEPATPDQKDAIRIHIRQKKWMKNYVRMWFAGLFGDVFKCSDPLEALTQRQADAAFTLLLAHGTGNYEKLRAELLGEGTVAA